MEKIYLSKRWFGRGAALIIILIMGIIWYKHAPNEEPIQNSWEEAWQPVEENTESIDLTESTEESQKTVLLGVHVTGAVSFPDQVYYLKSGSRVGEAIEAAGGAKEDADLSQLNLADYLKDGQRVYVPLKGEKLENPENSQGEFDETPLTNINLATKIELLTLPGIGEAYAQRILDYREKYGPFESIEDIMNVKGIGESKFAELKDRITVG